MVTVIVAVAACEVEKDIRRTFSLPDVFASVFGMDHETILENRSPMVWIVTCRLWLHYLTGRTMICMNGGWTGVFMPFTSILVPVFGFMTLPCGLSGS